MGKRIVFSVMKRVVNEIRFTFNAGKSLKDAVNLNNNDKLKVRLNEALNPLDIHAIDVLYHKKCWAINVSNLLRQKWLLRQYWQLK